MRCKACNRILEEHELTKKDTHGNFIDFCSYCLNFTVNYGGIEIEEDINDQYGVLTNDDDYDTLF